MPSRRLIAIWLSQSRARSARTLLAGEDARAGRLLDHVPLIVCKQARCNFAKPHLRRQARIGKEEAMERGCRRRIDELERRRAPPELGGGEKRIAAQHAKGKLTARERLDVLLDEGSFEEHRHVCRA